MDGLGADRYREVMAFLEPWFRTLQTAMGLDGWYIDWCTDLARLPDEQGSGGIYRFIGQKSAEIYLSEWSLGTHSAYELKITVLHELVHCHTQPMWEEHKHLSRQLGELIWGLLGPAYSAHEEYIADGLANVIGKLLPDPPDWKHLLSPTMGIAEHPHEGLTTVGQDDGEAETQPGALRRANDPDQVAAEPLEAEVLPEPIAVEEPPYEAEAYAPDDFPRTKKRPR